MSGRMAKRLTHPAHLKIYKELCQRHPWYFEASEMQLDWNNRIAKIRKMPGGFEENIKAFYKNSRPMTIEDDIAYAKAIQAHPDVLWYFEDLVRRLREDPDTDELHPDYVTIIGAFGSWYFFKQGLPSLEFPRFGGQLGACGLGEGLGSPFVVDG